MEILLKNVPSSGNSCVLYDCKDCGLSGAPDCQEMADFLGKKKKDTFDEQENTKLETFERLEKRIEELEKMHYTQPPLIPEVPKVTYEDIKKSVEELEKQKEKIERLQKEFIEEEIKNNPMFMEYYIDNVKKQLSLYGLPIYPDSSTDKNTFTFQRSDGEIIKVGLPSVTSVNPSALHYSSAPSGKIPMPFKESTELEFQVVAEKYLDSEWEKISLEILRKGLGLTQKGFSPEVAEKVSDKREKSELSKRVNSRKIVLRENFC